MFTFKHSVKKNLKSLEHSSNLRIAEMDVDFDCSRNKLLWNFPTISKKISLHILAELSSNFIEVEIAGIFLGFMPCLINPIFVSFKYSSIILKL